jgi:flagellar export protein FliJ
VSQGSPFRFRLERVRALRERQKEMARDQLAQAAQRLAGSQGRMRVLDARLERVRDEQRRIGEEATEIAVSELQARQAYAEHIEARQHAGAGEVARCEADVAVRRDALGAAAREQQTLERLKERQSAEHSRELAKAEGASLDEVALDRFRRSAA